MSGKIKTRFEHDDRVLRIRLAAPKANIIDMEMTGELTAAVARMRERTRLSLLVVEGEGDHFSFGASVPEHRKGEVDRMLPAFHRLFRELHSLDVPLLALVRGQCLGGGLELAAFCDFVFAEETAKLGLPEIKLAVFPPVGTALLPSRIGVTRAAEWILTGAIHPVAAAREAGLVNRVSKSGELEKDFQAWVGDNLLAHSASSLRMVTRGLRSTWGERFFTDLERLERLYLDELMRTHDAVEGVESFLQKRRPVWSHGTPP